MLSFMEDQLDKGSLQIIDAQTVVFRVKSELKLSFDDVQKLIQDTARQVGLVGDQLAKAQVQSVGTEGKKFEIVTIATTQQLVIETLVDVLGEDLNIQPAIKFDRSIKVFPIENNWLNGVIGEPRAPGHVRDYLGGVAFVVGDLDPAITTRQLNERLLAMRLQPDFENVQWRDSQIIGLAPAADQDLENTAEEDIKYTRVAVAVADPNYPYDEDRQIWQSELVEPERKLLTVTLSRATELSKVTQFAPQVAHQAKVSAILALAVAFFGIIMYLWIRFGSVRHGVAAVIALSHDVLICIAFVMAGSYLASTSFGQALGILDFKINLALVAAFLTVIGYSVNDTIVVYDRIRENRGKLAEISPALIDTSINQTLSRTVLTTFTTLMVMLILFVFGGEGVRGFSYVMIIGSLVGTYSSVAIASPLLLGWFGTLRLVEKKR